MTTRASIAGAPASRPAVAFPRVAISGLGIVSPLGHRAAEVWSALEAGQAAPGPDITGFDPAPFIKRRYLRPLDSVTIRCIAMTGAAMREAGLDRAGVPPSRVAIAIGSVFAGIGCIFDFKQACYEGAATGYLGLSPLFFPGIVFNSLSGQPAIEFGFTGPNLVVNSGFCSGLLAVIKGVEYLACGKADVVIAGGAEMSHPFVRRKLELEKDLPERRALGPDFRPAEAVCLFVLHREDDPRFAQAPRYGTIAGWSAGFGPPGRRVPALARAIQAATAPLQRPLAAVVSDGYPGSESHQEERAALAEAGASAPLLHNKDSFGHALGASSSLNLFHGLMFGRTPAAAGRPVLINSLDPSGNYAFMSLNPPVQNG